MDNALADVEIINDIISILRVIQDPLSMHYFDKRDVPLYIQNLVNKIAKLEEDLEKQTEINENLSEDFRVELEQGIEKETLRLNKEVERITDAFDEMSKGYHLKIQHLTARFKTQTDKLEAQTERLDNLLSRIRKIII